MLRITEIENRKKVRLRLDGTVSAVSFSEIEKLCSRHQDSDAKLILLDLGGVVFMNDEVARKFLALRNGRLRIVNCSPFIETLLKAVEE